MPKIMLKNTTETKSETNNTLSLTKIYGSYEKS